GCRYADGVLRTKSWRASSLRLLTDHDRDAVLAICDRDAVTNVFVSSRIRTAGLDPARLGAQLWGYQENGRLGSGNWGDGWRRTGASRARFVLLSLSCRFPALRWPSQTRWSARSASTSLACCCPHASRCSPRRWGSRRSAPTAAWRTAAGCRNSS